MIPVNVTVQFMRAGDKETRQVNLTLDATVYQTIEQLMKELKLPPGDYQLLRQRQLLADELKLFEVGIGENDILQLLAYDPNATILGRVSMSGMLSRMGSKKGDDPLPVEAALVHRENNTVFNLQHTRALIGRSDASKGYPPESLDADLSALDPRRTVSRPHGLIVYTDNEFSVRDLFSQLGIMVNGKKIPVNQTTPIRKGDVLSFGDVELLFEC